MGSPRRPGSRSTAITSSTPVTGVAPSFKSWIVPRDARQWGEPGTAINSMVSGGCIVSGAQVRESLLFFNVTVEEYTEIYRSVLR